MPQAVMEPRAKRYYTCRELTLTAGEWCQRFELGYSFFYQSIQQHDGDVEAAIEAILVMLETPDEHEDAELWPWSNDDDVPKT